jgi:hypothetical protein
MRVRGARCAQTAARKERRCKVKYFVIPNSLDGCEIPTVPEPIELELIASHLKWWLQRFVVQGYFSNCKQERIPLYELEFRLQPEFNVVEGEEKRCRWCGSIGFHYESCPKFGCEPPREPHSTRSTV